MRPYDGVSPDEVRLTLGELLREPDHFRLLDSLETLSVLAFLEQRGVEVGWDDLSAYPDTIDGWAVWVEQWASGEAPSIERRQSHA